jgi:hypothetical protein
VKVATGNYCAKAAVLLPKSCGLYRITPGDEGRYAKIFLAVAIGEGLAIWRRHTAACRYQQSMTRRNIPFANGGEARVDIGDP